MPGIDFGSADSNSESSSSTQSERLAEYYQSIAPVQNPALDQLYKSAEDQWKSQQEWLARQQQISQQGANDVFNRTGAAWDRANSGGVYGNLGLSNQFSDIMGWDTPQQPMAQQQPMTQQQPQGAYGPGGQGGPVPVQTRQDPVPVQAETPAYEPNIGEVMQRLGQRMAPNATADQVAGLSDLGLTPADMGINYDRYENTPADTQRVYDELKSGTVPELSANPNTRTYNERMGIEKMPFSPTMSPSLTQPTKEFRNSQPMAGAQQPMTQQPMQQPMTQQQPMQQPMTQQPMTQQPMAQQQPMTQQPQNQAADTPTTVEGWKRYIQDREAGGDPYAGMNDAQKRWMEERDYQRKQADADRIQAMLAEQQQVEAMGLAFSPEYQNMSQGGLNAFDKGWDLLGKYAGVIGQPTVLGQGYDQSYLNNESSGSSSSDAFKIGGSW